MGNLSASPAQGQSTWATSGEKHEGTAGPYFANGPHTDAFTFVNKGDGDKLLVVKTDASYDGVVDVIVGTSIGADDLANIDDITPGNVGSRETLKSLVDGETYYVTVTGDADADTETIEWCVVDPFYLQDIPDNSSHANSYARIFPEGEPFDLTTWENPRNLTLVSILADGPATVIYGNFMDPQTLEIPDLKTGIFKFEGDGWFLLTEENAEQPNQLLTPSSTGLHLIRTHKPDAVNPIIAGQHIVTGHDLTVYTKGYLEIQVIDEGGTHKWQPQKIDIDTLLNNAGTANDASTTLFDNDYLRVDLIDAETGTITIADTGRALSYISSDLIAYIDTPLQTVEALIGEHTTSTPIPSTAKVPISTGIDLTDAYKYEVTLSNNGEQPRTTTVLARDFVLDDDLGGLFHWWSNVFARMRINTDDLAAGEVSVSGHGSTALIVESVVVWKLVETGVSRAHSDNSIMDASLVTWDQTTGNLLFNEPQVANGDSSIYDGTITENGSLRTFRFRLEHDRDEPTEYDFAALVPAGAKIVAAPYPATDNVAHECPTEVAYTRASDTAIRIDRDNDLDAVCNYWVELTFQYP